MQRQQIYDLDTISKYKDIPYMNRLIGVQYMKDTLTTKEKSDSINEKRYKLWSGN